MTFLVTQFNIQLSRCISLCFAHWILSKALQILSLIACHYDKFLEESRELMAILPHYVFQTDDIMMVIFRALELSLPDHCMFWAACVLSHFDFLRSAEFTLNSTSSPSCLRLRLKASKTDPFHKDCFLHSGRGEYQLCTYRLRHRKCDELIFIHKLQNFGKRTSERSEPVSFRKFGNEYRKICTKHFLCCNLFIVYIARI